MSKTAHTDYYRESPETGDPMPEAVQDNIILRRAVWPRMHIHNKNWVAIFVGETGDGKSWGAARIAEAVDPNFTVDNIAFNVEEFLEIAGDKSKPAGSITVLDEAGVAASNRNWYEVANEVLNFLLQTWREQNRGAILTVPELDLIDKAVRRRFHHYFEMVSIDEEEQVSKAKCQYIDTDRKHGKNYFWYHRLKGEDGRVRKYKHVQFNPPSEDLREKYETRKQEYTQQLNEDLLEKIKQENSDEDDGRSLDSIVDEIVSEDWVDEYIKDNHGQKYVARPLLKADFDISEAESKQVKNALIRRCDLDVI
jgi:hypothetical protein